MASLLNPPSLATLCASLSLLTGLQAADITWQSPFNLTNDSQIITSGSLVTAVNATGDGNSQTVTIGTEDILFAANGIAPSSTGTGGYFTTEGGDTGNAALNIVLDSHSYGTGGWSFQLTGLTANTQYQIQLIGAADTRECCSSRNQRAGDGESPENLSGDFSRSGVGSVIGIFTADGSTQTINILDGTVNGVDPGISAYILRTTGGSNPPGDEDLRINEFLADPGSDSLTDQDGETSDWIELFNPGDEAISLLGWSLTDDSDQPTKWSFPNVSIGANSYLLVFASGKDLRPTDGSELHTNFSLSSSGEYLALIMPDGSTVASEFGTPATDYPNQKNEISFGYFGNPLQVGFLLNPTPNASNDLGNGVSGFVADTKFGTNRGVYAAPFDLTITTATEGAAIRYTTDGSWPSETTGTLYTAPISVDRTMAVKAIAYRDGYISTNIDTHTFILPATVIEQTAANTRTIYGLPSSWGNQSPYYGMDNNSNVNPATHPTLAADLTTVPSLSIAIDANDMFGSSGIYSNPGSSGTAWERKTSLEFVDPADPTGGNNFQQNCAIRIQGGAFRSFGLTRKKSFRVLFKSEYGTGNQPTGGPGSLKFPIFGTEPGVAQEFQTLIFRMESNDGWQWGDAGSQPQYARDEFGRRTQLALGQPAPHGRHLHVYINGVYWGVYNVVERPDASFAESYLDGVERDDWEGQNSGTPINDSSNLSNWNSLRSAVNSISGTNTARDAAYLKACGFNPDGSRNPAFPIWCDPSNNADYFITNWYGGNSDWPNKNYYGGIDSNPPNNGYKYFMWDSEWSLFLRSNTNYNRITDYRGIAAANDRLQDSPEFRLRFADRVHRALFNNGPLTPDAARERYDEITANHTSILNPEAARWGDQHGANRSVRDWQTEYNRITSFWFPVRSDIFLDSFRAAGLYPNLTAPSYSQHGGSIPAGTGPRMIAPASVSKIYYLFGKDDSDPSDYEHSLDPRLVGGEINPAATLVDMNLDGGGPSTTYYIESGDTWHYLDDGSNQGTTWRDAGYDDSTWKTGPSQLGYGDGDEATVVGSVDTNPDIGGTQRNATTYFRTTLNIPDPSIFGDFTLNYLFDDGIVVFVNGIEVARENLPLGATYDTFATTSSGDNAPGTVTLPTSRFVAGNNIIAVEIHQQSAGSSDMSFDLDLTANPPGGTGTRASAPIVLNDSGWLFSRSYDSATGEWSALNTAYFSPDTVPASSENLVISEINYHPGEPSTAAEIEASTDRDDYEFIELMNVGTQAIDLTGVRFTEGIVFYIADHTSLPPGGRLVLIKNREAFDARYPGLAASIRIATDVLGEETYDGRLSNSGERLTLLDAAGNVIHDFTYDDELPWPPADGSANTLVLKAPAIPIPDHSLASSWISSTKAGGAPGEADDVGFTGNALADLDGDGYTALLEYALGTSDTLAGDASAKVSVSFAEFTVEEVVNTYLLISYERDLFAKTTVALTPQISDDLEIWNSEPDIVFLAEIDHLDGTSTVTYRSASPISDVTEAYVRLIATQ